MALPSLNIFACIAVANVQSLHQFPMLRCLGDSHACFVTVRKQEEAKIKEAGPASSCGFSIDSEFSQLESVQCISSWRPEKRKRRDKRRRRKRKRKKRRSRHYFDMFCERLQVHHVHDYVELKRFTSTKCCPSNCIASVEWQQGSA